MQIKLPLELDSLISSDAELSAAFAQFSIKFGDWCDRAQPVFFPEYTDHHHQHISDTLKSAFDLVSEEGKRHFSATDAFVLTIATCLHDCGLLFSEQNFASLLEQKDCALNWPKEDCWDSLWTKYLKRIGNSSPEELSLILGTVPNSVSISQDWRDWSNSDKLLIGHFIRINHGRIAQHVSENGLPLPNTSYTFIDVASERVRSLYSLSGLIARSHTVTLRDTFHSLSSKFAIANYLDCHPVFIMSLLRVADYFQLSAARANSNWYSVRTIESPVSEVAWRVNQAVLSTERSAKDPEAIHFTCVPKDAESLLQLRDWLGGLQAEIDGAWAVLGEIYGLQHHTGLDALGLKGMWLRRVTSTIDDPDKYVQENSLNFVPRKFEFASSDANLMKILIAPLYNRDQSIGLRELIQNSVDATRERSDLADTEFDSCVRLIFKSQDGRYVDEIEIVDQGIGMDEEIIREYFLKIGRSFRTSHEWLEIFSSEDTGVRVARSGRFGIGILAAFLLGNRLEVTTRRLNEAIGYRFCATASGDPISVTALEDCPIGTRINVKCRENSIPIIDGSRIPLNFHYFGSWPILKVTLQTDDSEISLHRPTKAVPLEGDIESVPWMLGDSETFSSFHAASVHHWSPPYSDPNQQGSARIFLNGMLVPSVVSSPSDERSPLPNDIVISVYDPENSIELDLKRSVISNGAILEPDIEKFIAEDEISYWLAISKHGLREIWLDGAGDYNSFDRFLRAPIIYTNGGFVPFRFLTSALDELNVAILNEGDSERVRESLELHLPIHRTFSTFVERNIPNAVSKLSERAGILPMAAAMNMHDQMGLPKFRWYSLLKYAASATLLSSEDLSKYSDAMMSDFRSSLSGLDQSIWSKVVFEKRMTNRGLRVIFTLNSAKRYKHDTIASDIVHSSEFDCLLSIALAPSSASSVRTATWNNLTHGGALPLVEEQWDALFLELPERVQKRIEFYLGDERIMKLYQQAI